MSNLATLNYILDRSRTVERIGGKYEKDSDCWARWTWWDRCRPLSPNRGMRCDHCRSAGGHILIRFRSNGALRLTGLQEFTVQIDATDDPKSIRECDILIYTVKAQDTEAALTMTKHIQVRDFVISLQNGVVKDELLVNVFGRKKWLAALPSLRESVRHRGA